MAMTDLIAVHEEAPESDVSRGEALTIVGIGASAGGLKALQTFFESVPGDSGMAYVVIMHLDPERESRLAELLQDRTSIPVTQVTGPTKVEANHIYIIPPGRDLEMTRESLRVVERADRSQHAPVDLLLRSLAESFGRRAVGIVLSGTGSDGTSGIRHIKERGGITIAQTPGDAEFDGMPSGAIGTGQIDLVLPASEMACELLRMRRMPSPLEADRPPVDAEALLAQVFAILRTSTGHDFSLYKRSTVLRRLERRLRFNGARSLEEYLPLLRANETESRALVRDLLISVSGFFRDPEAFEALSKVIPALFEGKGPEESVRVWVVGCATGEEAYSLAILLDEYAATLDHPPRIQMFATDIDERGYAWGREALYPATEVADIPPERLRRYFTREAGGFRVLKSLREGVLFAVHNVLHDPPFSRIDLISCRNLLIYLQPEAQEQVLDTFHFALGPGSLLYLGASESAGSDERFTPAGDRQRIYRRDDTPHHALPRLAAADLHATPDAATTSRTVDRAGAPFSYGSLHLGMLETYAPASLIVDEKLDIVHRSARAGHFLHMGQGKPSHNLIDLVRGHLRMELRTALYQAFQNRLETTRSVPANGDGIPLIIRVHPPVEDGTGGRFALVVFAEQAPIEPTDPSSEGHPDLRAISHLEEELRRTKEHLESTSAAHDGMVEDLQSANEELQSINEEERAATEELETSREEIQSINEELTTINQEHQTTIEELKRTNADLQNLIESTEIGTIFLDLSMRIRRFTPSASTLFNFVPSDPGRPLAHITHRLVYPDLLTDAQSVLTSLARIERSVVSDSGEWYIVRMNPYRSLDDRVEGAILTFFNSTAQQRVEDELREAKIVAESANIAKGAFLATLSHEFRTPLNGMLGFVNLLAPDGPLNPAQERKVERIRSSIWHLDSMIDEILTFAKLDEGRESVSMGWFDARALAREAAALVEGQAEAKGLDLIVTLPEETIGLVSDSAKVRQILINLCGNAVKYTEQGRINLDVEEARDRVVFAVRDTGPGIALENQERIFERFWQVDSTSTRSFGGLGIGLAAAREFSRLLGGEVEVESVFGEGSTFRLLLPQTCGTH
ncbi:MAG: chemotaxis protein [Gemmatimonas sp.]|nr:chemotaxis protein [Gemmatimonas sp.]